MKRFMTTLHGRLAELRVSDLGGETALIDGRIVSRRPFAAVFGGSHFFDLTDAQGRVRCVELRVIAPARGLGLVQRLEIRVDGQPRAVLAPAPPDQVAGRCVNCGYSLMGLSPQGGEVRCPECGRHTPEAMVRPATGP